MRNLTKEIRISIPGGNIDNAVGLLDQGAPMVIQHFVIATRMKLYNILDLLLSRGWDINADVDTITPSALVYTFDDVMLLTWFLEHGADPNKRCQIRDCTPLSYAVAEASFEAIEILFRHGGSADQGQLLHYAAKRNQTDSLKVLKFVYGKNPEANVMNVNKLLDQDSPHDFAMNFRRMEETPVFWILITILR
ncbi:ankyrin repeat-containing domain protein [Penicillium hispanicum]|uniref:ankyrin repeat-containing domain protein n=1 Tax=Penicillium hispanicum TaxID=1080232 RepID=UPI0025422578|nr:ankyrin repeat-containing domain protein [Penicillium hispanicum]KAJ5584022.1 ankyrin repeat-containing domain protein [Penicillium hispanicum]